MLTLLFTRFWQCVCALSILLGLLAIESIRRRYRQRPAADWPVWVHRFRRWYRLNSTLLWYRLRGFLFVALVLGLLCLGLIVVTP